MDYEIEDVTWRMGKIGIIAVNYPEDGYWQAYIGVGEGLNTQVDVKYIIEWGDKLSWEEAQVYFPHLDITKYKTYEPG